QLQSTLIYFVIRTLIPIIRLSHITDDYLSRRFDRVIERHDLSVELHLVNGACDLADLRSWLESEVQDVTAHQQRLRRTLFDAERARAGDEPFLGFGFEIAFAPQAIGARDPVEQIQFGFQGQSPEHPVGYRFGGFEPLVRNGVAFDERERLPPRVV